MKKLYDPVAIAKRTERERARAAKCELTIVNYRSLYLPSLNTKSLAFLCENEAKYPYYMKNALERALDAGVMSLEKEGNFLIQAAWLGNFILNPRLDNKFCYIVNSEDAEQFGESLTCRVKTQAVSQGEYSLSSYMSIKSWKEIRAKSPTCQGRAIIKKLGELGVLTFSKTGGFSIVGKNPKDYTFNFKDGEQIAYFSNQRDACSFLEAIPKINRSELRVVKES